MKLGDRQAFPHGDETHGGENGLTVRQYYAGLAMAAMIEARWNSALNEKAELAKLAVELSDALLAELEK